jgi:hypothetical protein
VIWAILAAVGVRDATSDETKGLNGLHRLGRAPIIASFSVEDGDSFEVAAHAQHGADLRHEPIESLVANA